MVFQNGPSIFTKRTLLLSDVLVECDVCLKNMFCPALPANVWSWLFSKWQKTWDVFLHVSLLKWSFQSHRGAFKWFKSLDHWNVLKPMVLGIPLFFLRGASEVPCRITANEKKARSFLVQSNRMKRINILEDKEVPNWERFTERHVAK